MSDNLTASPMENSEKDDQYSSLANCAQALAKDVTFEEASNIIAKLGFIVPPDDMVVAPGERLTLTFLTSKYAIKIKRDKVGRFYYANKLLNELLGDNHGLPVVKVLAYDFFEKTDYEVLVMERAPGNSLDRDFEQMNEEDITSVFKQLCAVVKRLHLLTNPKYYMIYHGLQFETCTEYIRGYYLVLRGAVSQSKLLSEEIIQKMDKFIDDGLYIWETERVPVFLQPDIMTGNVVHQGPKLTAVIDFDYSCFATKVFSLLGLLLFIYDPADYKSDPANIGKKTLPYLFPILKAEFPEVFADPYFKRKLNVYGLFYLLTVFLRYPHDEESMKGFIEVYIPKEINGEPEGTVLVKIVELYESIYNTDNQK